MLIIHAPNIHHGGGSVLLQELLAAISSRGTVLLQVDARFSVPSGLDPSVNIRRIEPTVYGRMRAEDYLRRNACQDDHVLCFGNLPPLFNLRSSTFVFLQNRYLVDSDAPISELSIKSKIRLHCERIWLRSFRNNASCFIVQTPSMQILTKVALNVRTLCLPFAPQNITALDNSKSNEPFHQFDFIYIASGEAHKNHSALIDAWKLLANEGLFPSLALTLSTDLAPDLCKRVEQESMSYKLRIHNLGQLAHDSVLQLYSKVGALIYPSSFESFGLPLIEATQAGLPILAPELDYVRDIIDPHETFDPSSPVSIARAVTRYLKGRSPPHEIHSAQSWLNQFIAGDLL